MMDREPLAAALGDWTTDGPPHWQVKATVIAAARERLAQLPETCATCGGSGWFWIAEQAEKGVCPSCHGRGTVYPAELVDRIAGKLGGVLANGPVADWDLLGAVAVLDALNNETPKHLRKGAGPVVGPAELDALNREML